jgi:hypothetical protein
MTEKADCSGFCYEQIRSCLEIADFYKNPFHHRAFMRMAANWHMLAKTCDCKKRFRYSWCTPFPPTVSSPLVAQIIDSYSKDSNDPHDAIRAYSTKIAKD